MHKLHWSPSQIEEWLDSEIEMKAFYHAMVKVKIENDKKAEKEAKREEMAKRHGKKGKRR